MVAILIICPPDLSFIYSCNSDYLRQQKLISFRFANRLEFSGFCIKAQRSPSIFSHRIGSYGKFFHIICILHVLCMFSEGVIL